MKYVNLGKTALKVSRICLGTMNFGWHTSMETSSEIMSEALEQGVNFFDTADVYGSMNFDERGGSERIIGEWLSQDKTRRDKIILATKVYGEMGYGPNDVGLSAYRIKRCCEASLKRLQTEHIDLYQMHRIDRSAPWDEVWQAMEQLVREGKVTYIGTSNFAGWHITAAYQEAKKRNLMGLVSEQCGYSLLRRGFELDVIPACEGHGMSVLPWSPLASGLLGGITEKAGEGRRAMSWTSETFEKIRPQLEAWEDFCKELGEFPGEVAMAWLLSRPAVTAPVIGPRTVAQLKSALNALEIELSQEALEKINKIFPGPSNESPEAYWPIGEGAVHFK